MAKVTKTGKDTVREAVDSVQSEQLNCPNAKIWKEAFENKDRIRKAMKIKVK